MARIAGVVIPSEKQVQIALTYIYGIGPKHASSILAAAKIEPTTRVKDLTEAEEQKLRDIIDSEYTVEGDLQRLVTNNIKRLKDVNAYRGLRHKAGLPTRGQRTRTNARTRKGKAVAVGGSQPKAARKTEERNERGQTHHHQRRSSADQFLLVSCTSKQHLITQS